jgi:hypothetical protein
MSRPVSHAAEAASARNAMGLGKSRLVAKVERQFRDLDYFQSREAQMATVMTRECQSPD